MTLTVTQLANELRASGWTHERHVLILAARYYLGLETVESLRRYLDAGAVEFIRENR